MLKPLEIEKKWIGYEPLCNLHKTENNVKVKTRLHIIILWYEGHKSEEIAQIVRQTGVTVRKYMKRYNRRGLQGLYDKARPGSERKITEAEMIDIDTALKKSPQESGMEVNNWRGWVLQKYILKRFAKEVTVQTCYNILHRLKYSKTRAKKQNKKRDPEEAEKFREELEKVIDEKEDNTIFLYEDEAIFTSEPTATSVWTKIGEQPIVKTTGETRRRTVVFGAVNPETGDLYEQFSDAGNTENFKEFMLTVSRATLPKSVIMPTDNATYHHFKGIKEWWAAHIPNIRLWYLPSCCSDLNSIELLWKEIRHNVTHNTLFDTFELLISGLKSFLSKIKTDPSKLAKLCPFIY